MSTFKSVKYPLNIDPKLSSQLKTMKPDLVLIKEYPNSPEVGTIFKSKEDGFYPDQLYSCGIKYGEYEKVKEYFVEIPFNFEVIGIENNKITEVMMLTGLRRTFKKGDIVSCVHNLSRGFTTRWVISHFEPQTHYLLTMGTKEGETCEPYRLFGVGTLVKME
jgi:hypothetical protein